MRLLPRFRVAALSLFLLSIHSTSAAQDRPVKKINWGVTSLSGGNWIPWIAKEKDLAIGQKVEYTPSYKPGMMFEKRHSGLMGE